MRAVDMNVREHQVAYDAIEGTQRALYRASNAMTDEDEEATLDDVLRHLSTAMAALRRAREFVAGAKRPTAEITPRVEA